MAIDIPVGITGTDAAIIRNVVETLEGLKSVDGRLFANVIVVENANDFMNSNDYLAEDACAVVAGMSDREYGTDNGIEFKAMLSLPVIIRVASTGAVDFNELAAAEKLNTLADLVRQGLRVDKRRGGLAWGMKFGGKFIDCTSIDGKPIKLRDKASSLVTAIQIPVAVGWSKLAE